MTADHFLASTLRLDGVGALFVDSTWRANCTQAGAAWLDELGLHEARRRWRAGCAFAEIDGDHWARSDRQHGRLVVVLPALDPWSFEPCLEDLVAVDPAQPARWSTLLGQAVVLGDGLAFLFGQMRLRLHATPFAWAHAGGDGVAILDVAAARPLLVDRGIELVVDDIETGVALDRALRRPERLPRILVNERAGRSS